ncbi:MAG: hypothetical protein ACKO3G_11825, partial [Planctomycetaceae bacterium]
MPPRRRSRPGSPFPAPPELALRRLAEAPRGVVHPREHVPHRQSRGAAGGGDHGGAFVGIHERGRLEEPRLVLLRNHEEAVLVGVDQLHRDAVAQVYKENRSVIFTGNGYSAEWPLEAKERG